MSIYADLVKRVSEGETFSINFEKRTMKVGKEKVIDEGNYDTTKQLITSTYDPLDVIEVLYTNYKYSLPSERSESRRKQYFKALSIEEIPDERLFNTERREVARARLEGYVLCSILNGDLTWDETWGSWFYQSKIDPDLVLLKKWIN